jgi:Family of unknown function (DUF5681)
MTFRAGQSGNPNGRPKGCRNKQSIAIAERLEVLGCDSIEGMAVAATDPNTEINLRFQACKELAQYLFPKRKASRSWARMKSR